MPKITFVCEGNICRSPMAKMMFAQMLKQSGLSASFELSSAGTNYSTIGKDIFPAAKNVLIAHQFTILPHQAHHINFADYSSSDYVICMDNYNVMEIKRYFQRKELDKVSLLLDYTDHPGDIEDPMAT